MKNIDYIVGYLRTKGIPSKMIQQIRLALTEDAVQEADNVQWDRIYTAMGLAIRDVYGFGAERIVRCLAKTNEILESVGDEESSWKEEMRRLRDDAGVVVRTGDDRIYIEVD